MLKPEHAVPAQHCYVQYQQANAMERQQLLEELLAQHAAPLIRLIVSQKLRGYGKDAALREGMDLQQQIHLKLLARLTGRVAAPPIQDFAGYVAGLAFNACAEWQRQRQPQRHALKNRLRYLLTHTPGLSLWEAAPRVWWCGRSAWQTSSAAVSTEQLEACRHALPLGSKLRELTTAVFTQLGQPVELDDLVNLLAVHLGIHEEFVPASAEFEPIDPGPSLSTAVERRAYLQTLWQEIKQLPANQRCALLLNLRDPAGGNQLTLFHLTGVAGLRELAQALELSLEVLAELWNRLPLDDLTLAARLGVTRQQVINLRLAARRRLVRRLGLI